MGVKLLAIVRHRSVGCVKDGSGQECPKKGFREQRKDFLDWVGGHVGPPGVVERGGSVEGPVERVSRNTIGSWALGHAEPRGGIKFLVSGVTPTVFLCGVSEPVS